VRNDALPAIAGLELRWRTFRASGADAHEAADGDRSFGLWEVVRDLDALVAGITQDEFARLDERLPYFGTIWPAAEALVAKLLGGPRLDCAQVLDLGCGLGACGFAARRRGARVTFFDWEPRALAIVAASARAQGERAAECARVVGDWRAPPPCGPFDLILGADLLYEARNAPAVAAFLPRHLKPGQEAWIVDPGRPHAQRFRTLAQSAGLEYLGRESLPPAAPPAAPTAKAAAPARLAEAITLLRLRRPA
jgi:SAM-dependent methyltransferase